MARWVNTLATLKVPAACEVEGCEQPPAAVAVYLPDRDRLDVWTPGSPVTIQLSWGCEQHADTLAAGRSQWTLNGACESPLGERCADPVTHIAVMTETAKDTIVVSELCGTHADEVEYQRVDSIVPDYPPDND
jgi:hypothetical protein